MTGQQFVTKDVLRLEVRADPVGLENLISNPYGILGGWGWITPIANTLVTGTAVTAAGVPSGVLEFRSTVTQSAGIFVYSEYVPVVPGQYVAARWARTTSSGSSVYSSARLTFLDANKAVLSSGSATASSNANGVYVTTGASVVPSGAVYATLRIDMTRASGAVAQAGDYLRYSAVTVASATTSAALADLSTVPDPIFTNILGASHEITTDRPEMDSGELTATILSTTLDPSVSTLIRTGKPVRVVASGSPDTVLFSGEILTGSVKYDLADTSTKSATITLSAVDAMSRLANEPRTQGVATIPELPYVLEGCGVPWSVNGSGNQVATATVVSTNDNATAADQVTMTRDSRLGFAWVGPLGVINVWDAASMPSTSALTINEARYSDIDVDFDIDTVINYVTIVFLRYDVATGDTVEVPYGPYVNAASVKTWGQHKREFRVQGGANTSARFAAYGASILAANSTPHRLIHSTTLPVRTTSDIATLGALDICTPVTVSNTAKSLSSLARINRIAHSITPDKWVMTVGYADAQTIASPRSTPGTGGTGTGRVIDTLSGTVDDIVTPGSSDGSAPASSPTPTVRGGIGSLFITFPAVSNADAVTVDVYIGTSDPVSTSGTPAVSVTTNGPGLVVVRAVGGIPVSTGTTYYVKTVARDSDGSAAPSTQASGSPAQVTGPDIAVNALSADMLIANDAFIDALEVVDLTSTTLTGPTIRTAATGERIVIRNDGSGGIIESYSGFSGESPGGINPSTIGGRPTILMASGSTPTYASAPSFLLQAGASGSTFAEIYASVIQFAATTIQADNDVTLTYESWHTLSLSSPWTASQTVQYRRDAAGNVHLRGIVNRSTGATGSTIGTLPSGYTPSAAITVPVVGAGSVLGLLNISTGGVLSIAFSGSPATFTLCAVFSRLA